MEDESTRGYHANKLSIWWWVNSFDLNNKCFVKDPQSEAKRLGKKDLLTNVYNYRGMNSFNEKSLRRIFHHKVSDLLPRYIFSKLATKNYESREIEYGSSPHLSSVSAAHLYSTLRALLR
jgi:hypothetical protein